MVYQLTCSYFEPLIRSGVKIYTFTPGFLHAKTWLVDGRIAVVGSINLDYRSLYLHFECAALLYGCAALADVGEFMSSWKTVPSGRAERMPHQCAGPDGIRLAAAAGTIVLIELTLVFTQ